MSKGKKIVIGIICVLFLVAFGIYAGGVWFFSSHFLPGSALNGKNCSFKTEQEAQERQTLRNPRSASLTERSSGSTENTGSAQVM